MGVSYGGYLATSAAAYNSTDVSALVSRGGCSQTDQLTMHPWAGIERFYLYGFMEKFNVKTLDEAAEISHLMNVEPNLHKITCPVLVQHTEEDPVIGIEGPHYIYDHVSSTDKEYYEIPGNVHCGNNEAQKTCDYGVDWIVDKLTK
jgi:esterase/lipase